MWRPAKIPDMKRKRDRWGWRVAREIEISEDANLDVKAYLWMIQEDSWKGGHDRMVQNSGSWN